MISVPRVNDPRFILRGWRALGVLAGLCLFLPGCLEPESSARPEESTSSPSVPADVEKAAGAGETPLRVEISADTDDPNRWLIVEEAKEKAPGAWATGSFSQERNKVTIRTKDVTRFSIDVSRIPIKWDKLVILSIDGKNSELVRRDYALLHFVNDKYGWHVIEP